MTLIFFIATMFSQIYLLGQSRRQIKTDIDRIRQELDEIRTKREKEEDFFKRYKQRKEKIREQKLAERREVSSQIGKLERDLAKLRRENKKYEFLIQKIERDEKGRLGFFLKKIQIFRKGIEEGIPFEKDRRISVLQSLVSDVEAGAINSVEALTRLVGFFDTETVYAYDSQVFPAIVQLNGKRDNASVLRIGRVWFAAEIQDGVHLYVRDAQGRYKLSPSPLSLMDKLEIQKAMRIIQGQKAPELVRLPVLGDRFIHRSK